MARLRIPATTLRRVDKVESTLWGEDGQERGGVLSVPRILDLESWERLAVEQQRQLAVFASEDIHGGIPAPYREPLPQALDPLIEGVHFHRPDPYRSQAPMPLPAKRPPPRPKAMIR